jgi:hypothetical protein
LLLVQFENFFVSVAKVKRKSFSVSFSNFSIFPQRSLVSGKNLKKNEVEEINYFDGDAKAVTADLTENVDVSFQFTFFAILCNFLMSSDSLSRTKRIAIESEESRQRRSGTKKFHFDDSRSDYDKIAGKHEKFV